jgi:hypothetical protein
MNLPRRTARIALFSWWAGTATATGSPRIKTASAVDRAEALKFAMFENGNHPLAVMMVPGLLELDMSAKPRVSEHSAANSQGPSQRVA